MMRKLRLVNDNKGIEFEGMAYVYKTKAEAKRIMNSIEAVRKCCDVNVHKVLLDTCDEITDVMYIHKDKAYIKCK